MKLTKDDIDIDCGYGNNDKLEYWLTLFLNDSLTEKQCKIEKKQILENQQKLENISLTLQGYTTTVPTALIKKILESKK